MRAGFLFTTILTANFANLTYAEEDLVDYFYYKRAVVLETCQLSLKATQPGQQPVKNAYLYNLQLEIARTASIKAERAFVVGENIEYEQLNWQDTVTVDMQEMPITLDPTEAATRTFLLSITGDGTAIISGSKDFPIVELVLTSGSWKEIKKGNRATAKLSTFDEQRVVDYLRGLYLDKYFNNILGQISLRVPAGPNSPSLGSINRSLLFGIHSPEFTITRDALTLTFADLSNESAQSFKGSAYQSGLE